MFASVYLSSVEYRGFEIRGYMNYDSTSVVYSIFQKGEKISMFQLSSIKAIKNVIDTHVRSMNEAQLKTLEKDILENMRFVEVAKKRIKYK